MQKRQVAVWLAAEGVIDEGLQLSNLFIELLDLALETYGLIFQLTGPVISQPLVTLGNGLPSVVELGEDLTASGDHLDLVLGLNHHGVARRRSGNLRHLLVHIVAPGLSLGELRLECFLLLG